MIHFRSFPAFLSLTHPHIHPCIQHTQFISCSPLLHHVLLHSLNRGSDWVSERCVLVFVCSALISLYAVCSVVWLLGETRSPRPVGGSFDLNQPDTAYTQPPEPRTPVSAVGSLKEHHPSCNTAFGIRLELLHVSTSSVSSVPPFVCMLTCKRKFTECVMQTSWWCFFFFIRGSL